MATTSYLITGAGGFVGRWATAALRRHAPKARIVTSGLRSDPHDRSMRKLDVTNAAAVEDVVRTLRPTAILHLAAISFVPTASANPRAAWELNVLGTLNLATAVLRHAPSCRLVFASSGEIYGASLRTLGGPVDETTPLAPTNAYAATKAAADLMLGQMSEEGLDAWRLRAFNHVGPGQQEQFVTASFAAQIARIEAGLQPPVLKVGNLDAQRDFLDVRDVAEAYAALMVLPTTECGEALNIASGVPRRIGDVLEDLLAHSGVAVDIVPDPSRSRPSDVPLVVGDASRAREVLNWRPRFAWETTLGDILANWRARVRNNAPMAGP